MLLSYYYHILRISFYLNILKTIFENLRRQDKLKKLPLVYHEYLLQCYQYGEIEVFHCLHQLYQYQYYQQRH